MIIKKNDNFTRIKKMDKIGQMSMYQGESTYAEGGMQPVDVI